MRLFRIFLCMALAFSVVTLPAKSMPMVKAEQASQAMRMWYDESANIYTSETNGGEWMQQSLPLGNGDLGNLIFGGIQKERIHINQKTLWTGGPSDTRANYNFGNKSTAYTSEEIQDYRELLDDKSTNVFNDLASLGGVGMSAQIRFPGENNLYKGSYQDFADLYLDYSGMGMNENNVENYYRDLNLQTGIASTVFDYNHTTFKREHFVSYPDKVMVTKISAEGEEKLNINVLLELNNNNLTGTYELDEAKQTISIYGNVKDNGLKYHTVLKIQLKDGQLVKENQTFKIVDASEAILILAAETDYINDFPTYRDTTIDLKTTCETLVMNAISKGFDQLKQNHLDDHQTLFDRVYFDLYEDATDIPTDELVQAYRNGEYSQYLEVLSFQFGRYLTIAGSRGELPSNLVGLWTVGDSAWTGDYHFNVNVQMNYWPVYVTNLAECGETMVEYMESLREPGRVTAQYVHGIENATTNESGFTVHTENNPFGMCAPTNNQEYGWNPTGAAWAIQNIWAHYEFTQDEKYLKEVIYPIMKEATLFWDQYLWESNYQVIHDETSPYNGQNRVVVAPSFSEEQGPTTIGTTYDQSLVWELYKEVIEAAKIVGEDQALIDKWEQTILKLDPIEINATNGIKEWYEETRVGLKNGHHQSYAKTDNLPEIEVPNSGWNIGHLGEQRHASHLVGLYPGTLINAENEEYMNAAIVSLEERGEYSTGWSKANKINLWARTKNGNKAYKLLNNLIGGNSSGLQYNLFDSHGSGGGETMMNGTPVWQIDGNYGLTSGVAEMLLQSHLDYVEFLPALPDSWEHGTINGLKARGNFTINQEWFNHLPTKFEVTYDGTETSSVFVGTCDQICDAKVYGNGKEINVTKDLEKQQISFEAKPNVTYIIDMSVAYEDELKAQANELLETIHEDLVMPKQQLQQAMDNNQDLMNTYNVVKTIDETYRMYLPYQYDIYYVDEELVVLDDMYVQFKQRVEQLKNDVLTFEEVNEIKKSFNKLLQYLDNQRKTIEININQNQVTFEYDQNYDLRYTLDGSDVKATSHLYSKAFEMDENTIVKAALFENDQLRSKQFAKSAQSMMNNFATITSSHQSIWEGYEFNKAIDGDTTTRWASKSVDTTKDFEVIFKNETKQMINGLSLDVFVSNNNILNNYEIYALVNDEYQLIDQGNTLADLDDKTSDIDGASGGYHALRTLKFENVFTDEIKLVLKAGFVGEPSIYEAKYIVEESVEVQSGNADALQAVLAEAKNQDLSQSYLEDVEAVVLDAFTYIKAEQVDITLDQNTMDAMLGFVELHMHALGFRTSDKHELVSQIAEAMKVLESIKDERYGELLDIITNAQLVNLDDDAKQPNIDKEVKALKDAIQTYQLSKTELLINQDANSNIEIVSVTSQCGVNGSPSETGGGQIQKVLDYDTNTYWHSDYVNSAQLPQEMIIDLKESYDIAGIEFLPRQNGTNGDIFKIELYVSDSKDQFNDYETFEYENNGKTFTTRDMKQAFFEAMKTGRYLKIKIIASGGDNPNKYASMAELRIYGMKQSNIIYKEELSNLMNEAQAKNIDHTLIDEALTILENETSSQSEVNEVCLDLNIAMITAKDVEPTPPIDPKPTMDFYDVQDEKAWFYGSVEKAFQKGLMLATGKAPVDGKTWFEPDTNISRGMVATVLYRMAGQPKVEFKATFSDVTNANLWYSTAITWAAQNNVVSGYKDGRFGPDDNITRQDLAIMLRNYAKAAGLDTNVTVDFNSFKDGKQVVDYAASAVAWCVEAKLMSGSQKADGTYLMPTANATRAECAKMFSLLDDAIKANIK